MILCSWSLWVSLPLLSAPVTEASGATVTTRQQNFMSTYVTISVAAAESPEVLAAVQAGFDEVERLESLLSEWRPDSQISEVNRQAGVRPVVVGPELFAVIRLALQVSERSSGAFDVTFQALSGLWDFKASKPKLPSAQEVERRVGLVDFRQVMLDEQAHSVFLKKAGMAIGLGGIAKGYIVDRVSAVLAARGLANHLVVAGGDLYAAGTRYGRKWRIGVRHPQNLSIYATLEIQDEGVATSGNYEKYFFLDGKRYHHLLDPKTGWPARGTSSVTMVAKTAALSDAWATGLFVLGPERGLAVAEANGLEELVFTEDYQVQTTPGLRKRLVRAAP